jgi:hypothetical protein
VLAKLGMLSSRAPAGDLEGMDTHEGGKPEQCQAGQK